MATKSPGATSHLSRQGSWPHSTRLARRRRKLTPRRGRPSGRRLSRLRELSGVDALRRRAERDWTTSQSIGLSVGNPTHRNLSKRRLLQSARLEGVLHCGSLMSAMPLIAAEKRTSREFRLAPSRHSTNKNPGALAGRQGRAGAIQPCRATTRSPRCAPACGVRRRVGRGLDGCRSATDQMRKVRAGRGRVPTDSSEATWAPLQFSKFVLLCGKRPISALCYVHDTGTTSKKIIKIALATL